MSAFLVVMSCVVLSVAPYIEVHFHALSLHPQGLAWTSSDVHVARDLLETMKSMAKLQQSFKLPLYCIIYMFYALLVYFYLIQYNLCIVLFYIHIFDKLYAYH